MFSTSKYIIKIKLIYTNLFKTSLSPAFYTWSLSDLPVKTIISVIYLNSPALLPDFQLHWHVTSFHPSTQSYSLSCSKFFDTEMSSKISWRLCGSRFSSVASGTCCQDPACTTHTWTCRWLWLPYSDLPCFPSSRVMGLCPWQPGLCCCLPWCHLWLPFPWGGAGPWCSWTHTFKDRRSWNISFEYSKARVTWMNGFW